MAYFCNTQKIIHAMSISLNEFFNLDSHCVEVDEKEYKCADVYVDAARAFARNYHIPVFVVDFCKKEFTYVSGSELSFLTGLTTEQFRNMEHNIFLDFIPEEENEMVLDILRNSFKLFYSFQIEERKELVLSYFHHLESGNKKRLINNRVTPLRLTSDGKLWLAMCTFSISSRKEPGHVVMKKHNDIDYFIYSIEKHIWYHREGIVLTLEEKDILRMSSQGYTMKEIAFSFNKSEDTIKAYKRHLFAKLGVRNITEAVFAAINYDMLN